MNLATHEERPSPSRMAKIGTAMALDAPVQVATVPVTYVQKHRRALSTSWDVEVYIDSRRRANNGRITWGDRIYRALASPGSSSSALCCAYIMAIGTFMSVLTLCAQLEFEAYTPSGNACIRSDPLDAESACVKDGFFFSTCFFAAGFTMELLICLAVYPAPWRQFDVQIEFVSLVPFYLNIALAANGVRAIDIDSRGFRILTFIVLSFLPLRLVKISRLVPGVQLLFKALYESVSALLIPLYVLIVLFMYFGFLVFAVEFDPDDLENGSRVSSISEAMWMCIVTMTTVGYGDFSPQTPLGKTMVSFVMLFGLCFLAMPIAIVGNTFSEAWEARTSQWISELLRKQMMVKGYHPNDLIAAFEELDANSDGAINYVEFKAGVQTLVGDQFDAKRLRKLWKTLDVDSSDNVGYREFVSILYPDLESKVLEESEKTKKAEERRRKSLTKAISSSQSRPHSPPPGSVDLSSRLAAIESSLAAQTELSAQLIAQQAELQSAVAKMTEMLANAQPGS